MQNKGDWNHVSPSDNLPKSFSVLMCFFFFYFLHNICVKVMQHFIISVLHSSHSAGLWERRRDFDTKLWQTVRLRPDSHINGLQLHWLRHQQLHPAGCCAQGLSHYQWRNTLSTDKLANKQASTVGIDVWLPRCKLVAEYYIFFLH